jgi:lipoprotein signal peptidase
VFAVDQASKAWARTSLPEGRDVTGLPGWLWFRLLTNTGATLGLLSGHSQLVGILSLAVVAALAIVALQARAGGLVGVVALGAIVGGALGNLVDRVRFGAVTDFIEVRVWPTDFNLADAAIRLGVVVFLIALLWEIARSPKYR